MIVWNTASRRLLGCALAGASLMVLSACGGSGDGQTKVSNLALSGAVYSKTMTVSVSGSGLDAAGLRLETQGISCTASAQPTALEYQAAFTCVVGGVGPMVAIVRDAEGAELGRVSATVPMPRVLMSVSQGTRSGTFTLELDPRAAPVTALNFMRYVNSGFYANTIFHRVLAGQLAQGGQYLTDKSIRAATYDPIPLESANGLLNLRGTIGMARTSQPDSATAQFYLNLADNPAFDYVDESLPGYAVFGRVVSGLDVVDEIGKVTVYTYDNTLAALPEQDVVIKLATQIQ